MNRFKWTQITVLIILIIGVLGSCSGKPYVHKIPEEQYVVMLSLDGFRWDYPQITNMPNLESIAHSGVKLESLQPAFPSKTFPNHYSIATGLYPDHHGIVLNTFYDPEMDSHYKLSDRVAVENEAFYGGEPIWVTAEKQGLKTASFFWVGSEAPIKGFHSTRWKRYEHGFPYESRVDSVIAWLQLPKRQRPRLITWYMDQPDGIGHGYSPESLEVKEKLVYLDSLVGDFLNKLSQLRIADKVNIIITSDHGMARISGDKVIYFDDYIQTTWLDTALGGNPVWMLDTKVGLLDSVYNNLKQNPHIQVWKKDSIPERLHYGSHSRVMDLVVTADINWSLGWRKREWPIAFVGGTHGYDPRYKEMHGIFYAKGPAFKHGYVHPTVENVNIYPLIAKILKLKPIQTDGELENVHRMLKPKMLIGE